MTNASNLKPADVTTIQHIDFDKAMQNAVGAAGAFNKSGVTMIAACTLVMMVGAYGQDKARKWNETVATLTDNLKSHGLGETQLKKYIGYSKTFAMLLVKRDQFGGTVGKVLTAADVKKGHAVLMTELDRMTGGKNTLHEVGVAVGAIKAPAPVTPGSRSEPSSADVLAGADAKAKAKMETTVKAVNAQPEILAQMPQDTLVKAAEVIGFSTFVGKHIDKLTDAEAIAAFKKEVDLMCVARIKALKEAARHPAAGGRDDMESETVTTEPQAATA